MQHSESEQLAALANITQLFDSHDIYYWLFGGWAVDFHAGRVTRPHADVDLVIWRSDRDRVMRLLLERQWEHTPEPGEDGCTCYVRGFVRLETASGA